jgi:hypothetical protein
VCLCVRMWREGGGVLRGYTVELWDMAFAANRFTLDGAEYTLAQNNGPNALHGEGGGACVCVRAPRGGGGGPRTQGVWGGGGGGG